ncbi:hypothetical protein BGX28_009971 [Mortierella sp. GBA30]|nr:hypothetical protein BGX28_009971 [Mortierella sp. GBA30]
MTVDDAVMQKLWKLTNELTAQLVFNRNATLELKQQLADLQAKTAQGSVSISQNALQNKSQEHADYTLRIANERLQEENSQLQEQLREYERWMEYIMTKFRLQNFAMAQSRKDAMHEAYRMAEQEGELAQRLQEENALLQGRLVEVGVIARKAINEEYYNTQSIIETLEMENQGLREMLGVSTDSANAMAIPHPKNRVSFPSTGSNVASSGSDLEPQQQRVYQGLASELIAQETTTAIAAATLTSGPEAAFLGPVFGSDDKAISSISTSTPKATDAAEKFLNPATELTGPVDGKRKPVVTKKKPSEGVSTTGKTNANHSPPSTNTTIGSSTNNANETNASTGNKGGTITNISPTSKRNSIGNINSGNANDPINNSIINNATSSTSTTQKTKKTNRKQKS